LILFLEIKEAKEATVPHALYNKAMDYWYSTCIKAIAKALIGA
jgi:hypothetical protein